MKTMSDYPDDVLVTVKLFIADELMIEMDMKPDLKLESVGISLLRWDDFSVIDTRDLFKVAQESLTRLLVEDHNITVIEGEVSEREQRDQPF